MLTRDNVPAPGMPGLAQLGIEPASLEAILPTYLDRFRHRGIWRPRTT
jgi:NADH dehydrogenase